MQVLDYDSFKQKSLQRGLLFLIGSSPTKVLIIQTSNNEAAAPDVIRELMSID